MIKNKLPLLYYFPLFLFSILLLTGCEGKKPILNDLFEKEANEILVFLSNKGIVADKAGVEAGAGGGATMYSIIVNESEAIKAMGILNQAGLPRKKGQSLLNLFAKGGLVPSEMEEKIRYRAGLEEDLANTIRKIDGVIDADVQLSIPEDDDILPGQPKPKSRASVFVKHQGILDDPNSHIITKIQRWIASSINGLDYDDVTVIANRSRFTDLLADPNKNLAEEEKEYVSIWTVVIAKESVSRFRTLFFSMTLLLLLFVLAMVWFVWKASHIFPLLSHYSLLFTPNPLTLEDFSSETSEKTEDKKENKEEDDKDEEESDEDDDDEDDDDEDEDEDEDEDDEDF